MTDFDTSFINTSLDRLKEVHSNFKKSTNPIYPNDQDIQLLSEKFLSVIYNQADDKCLTSNFSDLCSILFNVINKCIQSHEKIKDKICKIIEEIPIIAEKSFQDIDFAFNEDPAVFCREEIIKCYPFAKTVPIYRLANIIDSSGIKILPRMLTEYMHSKTGIDIHPSACIDSPFFIDHGTGVVIGGTAIIGKNVKIFHGVTLGAKAFSRDIDGMVIKGKKRHPTIKDNVTIYSGSVVLGGDTIIESNSVIGGNAWITHGIPKNTMVLINEESLLYIRNN